MTSALAPIDRRQVLESFAAKLAEQRRRNAKAEHQTRGYRDPETGEWRGGLLSFVRYFWHVLEPGTEFVSGWVLEAIAEHLEAVTFGDIQNLLINVFPGAMKALDCDTPILTTWGWKRHGDLVPGDFVFAPNGKPVRVEAITPHKIETAYEIEFDDETKIVAGAGHLWKVERDYPYGSPEKRRIRKEEIVRTPDLIPSIKGRGIQRPDRIPVCSPIQMPPKRLLIDPYLLGAWLGDGATLSGVLYCAEQDREHFQKLGRIANTVVSEGKQDFHRIAIEGFQTKLRIMGLLGNKHIPDDYLEASIDQRLELLRGLMDTDGCATARGNCTYTTKLRHLADQILTLLCSLGIKSNIKEQWSKIDGKVFGPYWGLSFTVPEGMKIFNLPRKHSRMKSAESSRSTGRYVTSVSEIGERWVNCIQVEGGMYLAGKRFLATHNSLLTDVFWPAWEWSAMNMPHLRYVAFSYSASLTERDNGKFRDLMMHPEFQAMYGDRVQLRKTGETKVTNTQHGWKLATSVGGVGTGERGDRIICDDGNNVKESESETIRNETNRWFRESMSSRLNNMETGSKIVIAQRVHEEDLSGLILSLGLDYVHLCIPMKFKWSADENGNPYETSIGWSDPRWTPDPDDCEDELAWPERFPPHVVQSLEKELGPYATAGQLQQTPEARGGGIFKRHFWQPWEPADGKFPAFSYVVASLDSAFTANEENDPSALTVWGIFDHGGYSRVMLVHAWRRWLEFEGEKQPDRPNPGESILAFRQRVQEGWGLVEWVADTCTRFKVDRLLIEAKASGISAAQVLRKRFRRQNWSIVLTPVKGDKVARAHAVQSTFSQELVYIPMPLRKWGELVVDEMAVFPKAKYDDLTDSSTMAIKHLRDLNILVDDDEARAEVLEELQEQTKKAKIVPIYPC